MIHPTALVDPKANIHTEARVGPYCVIGPQVSIGAGTELKSHVVIEGLTVLGEHNLVYPFASLGQPPQDLKYRGENSRLIVGDRNTIRESVTFSKGTQEDANETRIGHDGFFMANCHVAHDCVVGDGVIMANGATLAGHVHMGDLAILGPGSLVHQFTRIGAHSFSGMGSIITQDIPPFVTVAGNHAKPYGLNKTGLKRRGFSAETLRFLAQAYRLLIHKRCALSDEEENKLQQACAQSEDAQYLYDFVRTQISVRGVMRV